MGFDDFFESKQKHHGTYREKRFHNVPGYSHDYRQSYQGHRDHLNWFSILEKIRSNKKLKLFIILAGIFIITIVIAIIIVLYPLIIKLFNYVDQNGLQGLLDSITSFLDKMWKGTGN